MNVDPLPTALFTDKQPPWASAMRLHIGTPKPIPFAFVVNSGVPSLSATFLGMPTPVSLKAISRMPFDSLLVIVSSPPSGMASMAFLIMLTKTLFICSESTFIFGSLWVESNTWML